jgi:hypothetical protein
MDDLERARTRIAELEAALAAAKGAPNLVTRPEAPTFKRSDLRDAAFFAAHRKDILAAASHGRIIDDMPAMDLESAVAGHYAPSELPPSAERKALERRAFAFHPDPQQELEIAARNRDPKAFDAAQASMHVSGLPGALYRDQRAAAIELGAFSEPTATEGSKS